MSPTHRLQLAERQMIGSVILAVLFALAWLVAVLSPPSGSYVEPNSGRTMLLTAHWAQAARSVH